ncbi:MAG: hypothetical protein GWN99_07750 [Gemmatimonadetes bacterium]|uniref:6-bladed beta-propeller protein n=1 Tax=Candidatus Kutchimonas denitrificans TaxID=3056748 RepID=A0AAE5CAZ4_9BACT|nr:hypothetical protein [Gemmatimonadota bacterium]NIR75122.1 hypothetical protein [Candidatus Kutchimonas denitrificans]NIS00954.1 hypothetical protein [Gemmatimonadota bacterium]NIT66571.1 hypothetical protein [Gemmatimonadota bacterium]NIU52917.1 hypothetical protein [Gemmatimonadota bacterium]
MLLWRTGSAPAKEAAEVPAFTAIRSIGLRAEAGGRLTVTDLLPVASGRIWVADARAGVLEVYSQAGRRLTVLGRAATGLRRPVSLTGFHGRWIVALDGGRAALSILDERGRTLRRFLLPEVDRPRQVCNVDDRLLAVVGTGWGRGAGRLLHLYTPSGEHLESLHGEPSWGRARVWGRGRAYATVLDGRVCVGDTRTDSFAIYDLDNRGVLSFTSVAARLAARLGRDSDFTADLRGLFATTRGPLIALYLRSRHASPFLYDAYAPDGRPLALGWESRERIVGIEGPLFYSVRRTSRSCARLRVWKLRYGGPGTS